MLYQGIIGEGSSPVEPEDLSPVLLWTNPSPTSEFAAERKVELDLTNYTGVIIEFKYTNDDDFVCNRTYVKKVDILNKKLTDNSNVYFGGGCGYTSSSGSWASRGRIILSVDNSGVTFGNGGYANSAANSFLIPIRIYGVKEYVVEPVVGDLLWTNARPNAELGRTEIPGNFSKYKSIIVKAKANTTSDYINEFNISKSSSAYSGGMCFVASGQANLYRIVIFTDEKITISAGSYETSGTSSDRNNVAIPLEIYGIE